jgi:integrase/recombinase XerC
MSELAVIDRQTQILLTTPIYVAGENTLARIERNTLTPRQGQRSRRGLKQANASHDLHLKALASDATDAIRDWQVHNEERLRAGLLPDRETVRGFIQRVVDAAADLDGITAWLMLDSDKPPSDRTISEYQGTVRDMLLWLAERGLCPATASRADLQAYIAWMQPEGAPVQMEKMRARWYGYEPRVQYVNDWRGWAALAVKRLYAEAVRDAMVAVSNAAHDKKSKVAARLAQHAVERCWGYLALMLVLVQSYEKTPRRARFEKYSSATISLRLTLTRSFWQAALKRQAVFENPLSDVKVAKPKTNRRDQILNRRFSDDEVAALLEHCAEERCRSLYERAKAARDKALIALPAVLGLLVSEESELNVSDYKTAEGEFGTLYIRGSRCRAIPLTEKMQAVLDSHLRYRALLNPTTPAMFVTMNHGARRDGAQPGERISPRAIRDMFDERQRALNMKRPGRSVHGLRHRFATKAMRSGGDVCLLSETLGHSQLAAAQIYMEVVAFESENLAKLTDNVL